MLISIVLHVPPEIKQLTLTASATFVTKMLLKAMRKQLAVIYVTISIILNV